MNQDEKHQKALEATRKQYELTVNAIYKAVKANDARMDIIRDPVSKNLIPIYMISSILDIASVFISRSVDSDLLSEETMEKLTAITEILSSRLNLLIEWIQSPIYSPDNPVGNAMMGSAKKEFASASRLSELEEELRLLREENQSLRVQLQEQVGDCNSK